MLCHYFNSLQGNKTTQAVLGQILNLEMEYVNLMLHLIESAFGVLSCLERLKQKHRQIPPLWKMFDDRA